jgi:TolB-like protein/Tfp pilus assembly protein PilF
VLFMFSDCSLDTDRRELRRGADLVAVEPQVFDVLVYLIQNRDRVVSRDDLLASVWGGRIVSESTLSSRINAARSAIGDSGDQQRLIRTIPRKGFRFVGQLQNAGGPDVMDAAHLDTLEVKAGLAVDGATPPLPNKPSIAVLPFTNMSDDSEQEYFSDGITEDIITALSRLRWFFVIARNSTFTYKSQSVDVRQVGRDLGVRYVLEGSVRKSRDRLRITSQLLDATSGNHIWAERYDRELSDIFALQDEITASVTAAIEPKLVAAEGLRARTRSTDDLDAWDHVARALSHFWVFNAEGSRTAVAMLRKTARLYPHYAPAQSMLSFALIMSAYVGWLPDGERELAEQLAYRAAELDEGDPWAHMTLGYLAITSRQTNEAVRHFQAAIDLNPNFAAAHGSLGWALGFDAQSNEAMPHLERARRMSPRDPFTHVFFAPLGAVHYMAGRYEDAVRWARQAVQLRPGYLGGHRILCASLAQAGHIEEARATLSALRQLHPQMSVAWIKQCVPFTDRAMPRFLDGLRKAGLSEH